MPQLRLPERRSFVKTMGRVMKGPPSSGQHVQTGRSRVRSNWPFFRITSLHGPDFTALGMKEASSASWGSILILSSRPCGCLTSKKALMRWSTSS